MKNRRKEIRVSDEEYAIICKRAEKLHMTVSDYIRKISVYGEIKVYDTTTADKLITSINRIGTLVNQIAMVCNSTKSVYADDVKRIQIEIEEIHNTADNYLSKLEYEVI